MALFEEVQNPFAYQISMRHLNPRLRYYYFRFVKTNSCHTDFPHSFIIKLLIVLGISLCIDLPDFIGPQPSATGL